LRSIHNKYESRETENKDLAADLLLVLLLKVEKNNIALDALCLAQTDIRGL
jgi:hypothetical protein